MVNNLEKSVLELIRKTSTSLPRDVVSSLKNALKNEKNARAKECLEVMLENNEMAKLKKQPICQDTGNLIFKVLCPIKTDHGKIEAAIKKAVAKATKEGILRKNSINAVTGVNSGDNLGPGTPQIKYENSRGSKTYIYLILKGGGCENVSRQYSVMEHGFVSEDHFVAAEKAILGAVQKAQGFGCSPGFLGVCLGGDRETGYAHAKNQLFRKLNDKNTSSGLAKMEESILKKCNSLNIGPMGMGGNSTVLSVKIGHLNRVAASYFVTVSYMCWAFRRQGVLLDKSFNISKFLY
ncbi:fumarate hydratase [Patescibacteria group bacterium]|nr:fumarate hydratase [Patescibacteria group bacterium]